MLCISPEFARIFVDMLEERVPGDAAKSIRELYRSSTGFEA